MTIRSKPYDFKFQIGPTYSIGLTTITINLLYKTMLKESISQRTIMNLWLLGLADYL